MKIRTRWIAGATLLGLLSTAHADDPSFKFGSADDVKDVKKVEWKASAQGGLILSSGNSRSTTLSMGATASRRDAKNKLQLELGAAYSRSQIFLASDANMNGTIEANEIEGVTKTSTKSYSAKARYDRFFTAKNSLFATLFAMADEPAGKDLVAGGQLGYSRLLYKSAVHELAAELGYDFSHEDYVAPGDPINIHSLRGFVGYTGTLSADTAVGASGEYLVNLNQEKTPSGTVKSLHDERFTGKANVTTKLHKNISFRFGFTAHFDQSPAPRPPFGLPYAAGFVPLADRIDTTTEATIIVSFL